MGLILTGTYLLKGIPMMTSSNGNIIRVTGPLRGESTGHRWFPLTKPVTRNFDVFFDLRLNKRLSKHSRRCWFETPSRSLHYDVIVVMCVVFFFFQIEGIEDEKKSQDEWKWSEWSGTTLLWYGVAYREPVPLTIFRSNSKFDQILERCGLKMCLTDPAKFCTRHDSVTLVTCAKFHFHGTSHSWVVKLSHITRL